LLIPVQRDDVKVSIRRFGDNVLTVSLVKQDGSLHPYEECVDLDDFMITPPEADLAAPPQD
jgi:hypothetical protein